MRCIYWVLLLLAACGKSAGQKPVQAPQDTNIIVNDPNSVNVNLDMGSGESRDVPAASRTVVEFAIPAGTGGNSWNSLETRLVLFQGQILRLRNNDSIPHTMHTNGRPCEHGTTIKPGETFDCPLDATFDARSEGPLYDHEFPEGKFWFTVLPAPGAVLSSNCLSCHSKARAIGGLDLESSPLISGSADIKAAFAKRLAKDAADNYRMPPASAPLAAANAESLIAWSQANFFKAVADAPASIVKRNLRWQLLQGGNVLLKGDLSGQEKSLTFARRLDPTTLRFEELIDGQWVLLLSVELILDRDRSVTLPVRPLGAQMAPGYYGIDDLYAYAKKNRLTSVAEFIQILPKDFHDNFVLMKETRSRHLASAAYPRGILFSRSARLLLAFSSHPDDPLRETVELAEAMEDGTWKYREIRFEKKQAVLNSEDAACRSCHSEKPRPIWGSYPDWPGAYGDSGGRVSKEEYAILKQLAVSPQTKDRFASVNFKFRDDLMIMTLPERRYDYPNTVFNFELGRTASHALAQRVKQQANAKVQFARILQNDFCEIRHDYESFAALDMDMGLMATSSMQPNARWFDSANSMDAAVGYWALMELLPGSSVLQGIMAPVLPRMQDYARLRDEAGLEVSADYKDVNNLRFYQYTFPRVLDKETTEEGKGLTARRAEFCKELANIVKP